MFRHESLIRKYWEHFDEESDAFFFKYEQATAEVFMDFSGYQMGCFFDEGTQVFISFGQVE